MAQVLDHCTTPTNSEGLTWEEWVCAAACAKFTSDGSVQAFTTTTTESSLDPCLYPEAKPTVTHNYPPYLYGAWQDGEDPTEWRAYYEQLQSCLPDR